MRCFCYCTASSYAMKPLLAFMKDEHTEVNSYRDVIYIKNKHDIFYFSYGCIVIWGLQHAADANEILEQIKPFENEPLRPTTQEIYRYKFGDIVGISTEEDVIILKEDDPLIKLSFSYGLAQSIKLISFEDAVSQTIAGTQHIPIELARKGKISLSRKEISRSMGQLFMVRSSINLSLDFLDVPEFFWENPMLESYYKIIAAHLEISKRVEILNRRLDVIHELFNMLTNELRHQHSSVLELIIIYLIAIDIVIVLITEIIKAKF